MKLYYYKFKCYNVRRFSDYIMQATKLKKTIKFDNYEFKILWNLNGIIFKDFVIILCKQQSSNS